MADLEEDPALAGGLPPDHPLLARAQDALKKQLLTNKKRLEDEVREKQNALKVRQRRNPPAISLQRNANSFSLFQMAKAKRENIGVELYGFQQGLAKLQMQLESTHQNYQAISKVRTQVQTADRPRAAAHGLSRAAHLWPRAAAHGLSRAAHLWPRASAHAFCSSACDDTAAHGLRTCGLEQQRMPS